MGGAAERDLAQPRVPARPHDHQVRPAHVGGLDQRIAYVSVRRDLVMSLGPDPMARQVSQELAGGKPTHLRRVYGNDGDLIRLLQDGQESATALDASLVWVHATKTCLPTTDSPLQSRTTTTGFPDAITSSSARLGPDMREPWECPAMTTSVNWACSAMIVCGSPK